MNRPDADDVTTTKWSLKPVFNICTTILTKVSDRKPGAFGHFYMSDRKTTVSGANLAQNVIRHKMSNILTFYHKSVVFYYSLPQ